MQFNKCCVWIIFSFLNKVQLRHTMKNNRTINLYYARDFESKIQETFRRGGKYINLQWHFLLSLIMILSLCCCYLHGFLFLKFGNANVISTDRRHLRFNLQKNSLFEVKCDKKDCRYNCYYYTFWTNMYVFAWPIAITAGSYGWL